MPQLLGGFHLLLRYTEMAEGSSPAQRLGNVGVKPVNDHEDLVWSYKLF